MSDVDPLVLGCCDDGWKVVRQYREDERLDTGSVFEDSDYEAGPELADEPTTEGQDDENEDDEREIFPVIAFGSFSR